MKKEGLFSYWQHASFKRYRQLLDVFGSLERAFANTDQRKFVSIWKPELASDFLNWKYSIDETKLEQELHERGIKCIGYTHPEFPEFLGHLHDPPVALFVRGTIPKTHTFVSVVGTRKYSSYGRRVTHMYVRELSRYTICIVSGLAFGIDAIAHRAALEFGIPTIAVLPGSVGPADIAPQTHTGLAEKIIHAGGALVSEHPPGFEPFKSSFARRNRIVAALSKVTLVVEAPEKSGALITADVATDLGRDVFAVPHDIYNLRGIGTNALIAKGAYPAHTAQSIPQHLGLQATQKYDTNNATQNIDGNELRVLNPLSNTPMHIDELSRTLNIHTSQLLGILTELELKGFVQNIGSMNYIKHTTGNV